MIQCLMATCAEQLIRNAETNTVSIISMIEEISVPRLPGVILALNAFFLLERAADDPESPECIVRLKLDDQVLQEFPAAANFQGKLRTRAFVTIGNVALPGPGEFSVSIARAGEQEALGSWRIKVSVIAQATAAVTNA